MPTTPQTAQDDLAFMRSLIGTADGFYAPFGQAYFMAGACYTGQMVLTIGQMLAWFPSSPIWSLTIGFGPTVLFLAILTWINRRAGRATLPGLVGKTIAYVFGAVGFANLALVAVIGSVAWRQHDAITWLIYPCAVFVLQGAAWLVAYSLRRRIWLRLVGVGWFSMAIAMALSVRVMPLFLLSAACGFLFCMLIPGAILMRLARKRA